MGKRRTVISETDKNYTIIFHKDYLEHINNGDKKILHIYGYNTDIIIKQIFITDELPDIVIPNRKDFTDYIQAYYPPEGYYNFESTLWVGFLFLSFNTNNRNIKVWLII